MGDLGQAIRDTRQAFSEVLTDLSDDDWDNQSLCAGWRVREVVAHLTMPFRYRAPQLLAEMIRCHGHFTRMSDVVARRDAQAPIHTLLDGWVLNENHPWKPPGGGLRGALTHDVVHGLDITIPLGISHPLSAQALRVVLDQATSPRSLKHFSVDLTGIRLEADDLDWSFGDGEVLSGAAHHLVMVLMDRSLPAGLLSGGPTARFTA